MIQGKRSVAPRFLLSVKKIFFQFVLELFIKIVKLSFILKHFIFIFRHIIKKCISLNTLAIKKNRKIVTQSLKYFLHWVLFYSI